MSSEIIDILNKQVKKINESQGTFLTSKIYQIQISLMAFEKNYKDLEKSLIDYSNPRFSVKLWELGKKERARLYYWNVSRLLQNFLSAATTFRDHLRFITRQIFCDHMFLKEYEDKINKTFSEDPLSNFIMKFRNNYLHTCVSSTSASFELDPANNKIISEILINKKELIDTYDSWNARSKEFINSLPEQIPLINIVKEYFNYVFSFYHWYEQRYFEIFENEFENLNKLKEEYNQLQKELLIKNR